MTNKYEEIFNAYKKYINDNSQYSARVVKYNTNTSTYFPIITFILSNYINTDDCSINKLEYYDSCYFTIDIYTQDNINDGNTIPSQIINNELIDLTIKFFDKLNMKRTSCKPVFNIDDNILRTNIQYQCMIGNARGNIIRR